MKNLKTKTGNIFIISAPSGTGKTSLVEKIITKFNNISVSISYTTRSKRISENHGEHYYFINKETFQKMIGKDLFLEYSNIFGNFYGTSKLFVENELKKNNDVILKIDYKGAKQIIEKLSAKIKIVSIFILPPSTDMLKQRLINRNQDSSQEIEKRMAQVNSELSDSKNYDYIITNNSFEKAVDELEAIIQNVRDMR